MSEDKDKTKEEIDRLLEQYEKEKQNIDVNVKVDTSQIQKELMSWRLMKKKFINRAKELGLTDEEIGNVEDFADLEALSEKMNEKKLELEMQEFEGVKSSKAPSGSVPLSSQQTNEPLKFSNYKEMYDFLYRQTRSKDRETALEAKKILDKMFEKWIKGSKHPSYKGFMVEDKSFSITEWREKLNREARRKRGLKTEEET